MNRVGLALCLALAGCAGQRDNDCHGQFLLLWPNSSGEYAFQEVHLATLKSTRLEGPSARVHFESFLSDQGYQSPAAEPRFTLSGRTCVPLDSASHMAVSVFAQMERLHSFDQRLGLAHALTWPRMIGVEQEVNGSATDRRNNAHYFTKADSIALVPYSLGDMPIALNHGVLAHEHFHAHFQARVVNPINAEMKTIKGREVSRVDVEVTDKDRVENLAQADRRRPRGRNAFVLRAWNEGLADFYAAVYTGEPNFFHHSLPGAGMRRDLRREPEAFADWSARWHFPTPKLTEWAYLEGEKLASLLFAIAQTHELGKESLLSAITSNLEHLPEQLIPEFHSRTLAFDDIVPLILAGVPVSHKTCRHLKKTLSRETLTQRFRSCLH